jgi:hypothetical protein
LLTFAGIHGDLFPGWDTDVLQNVIDDPTCGDRQNVDDPEGSSSVCNSLKPSQDIPTARACSYSGNIVQEPVGLEFPIDKLPGCNLLYTPPNPKPACSPAPPVPFVGVPDHIFNETSIVGPLQNVMKEPVATTVRINPSPPAASPATTILAPTPVAAPEGDLPILPNTNAAVRIYVLSGTSLCFPRAFRIDSS